VEREQRVHVGGGDADAAARSQHAVAFAEHRPAAQIGHVLDVVLAEDVRERAIANGSGFPASTETIENDSG